MSLDEDKVVINWYQSNYISHPIGKTFNFYTFKNRKTLFTKFFHMQNVKINLSKHRIHSPSCDCFIWVFKLRTNPILYYPSWNKKMFLRMNINICRYLFKLESACILYITVNELLSVRHSKAKLMLTICIYLISLPWHINISNRIIFCISNQNRYLYVGISS